MTGVYRLTARYSRPAKRQTRPKSGCLQPAGVALSDEHCFVGIEQELAVSGRVAVRGDMEPSAATDVAVVLIEPGVQAPHLLRAPAVWPVQRTGEAVVGSDDEAGREYVIDAEEPAERTEVDLERRRDQYDDVACVLMVTKLGEGVRPQPRVVHHPRKGCGMATDFGNRATAEGRPGGQCFERITIAPRKRSCTAVGLTQQIDADRPAPCHEPEERNDAVACREGAIDIEGGQSPLCRIHSAGVHSAGTHWLRAGMASSASQNAGQLFETTPGSLTSMPSTTSPRMPNAIPRR